MSCCSQNEKFVVFQVKASDDVRIWLTPLRDVRVYEFFIRKGSDGINFVRYTTKTLNNFYGHII